MEGAWRTCTQNYPMRAVISASVGGLTDKFQRFRRLSRSLDYQLGSSRTIRTVLVNQTLDLN